jgi:hypothetical protein
MVSFAPTTEETTRDQRLYLDARLTEVACLDCLAKVRVKKNSEHHTSIQWTEEAVSQCAEFRKQASQPEGRVLHTSCSRLRSSIDQAVRDGAIEIGAEDGY